MIKAPLPLLSSLGVKRSKFLWNLEHPQNVFVNSMAHYQHFLKISLKSIHNFLRYVVHNQTKHILPPLAEVTIWQQLLIDNDKYMYWTNESCLVKCYFKCFGPQTYLQITCISCSAPLKPYQTWVLIINKREMATAEIVLKLSSGIWSQWALKSISLHNQ